jgi:hypothetical protein
VGGSAAGAEVSVGTEAGVSAAWAPQAANNPAIKTNIAILASFEFMLFSSPKNRIE